MLLLAVEFRTRLSSLVVNWVRVGYCQGNFNSDNCAAGGFTLDYGPFGFCDVFDPYYQPWTNGGEHFSFFNQDKAAEQNFHVFCTALLPLLGSNKKNIALLEEIRNGFSKVIQSQMGKMWADKLGLKTFNAQLYTELEILMVQTSVDYTLFFRELLEVPDTIDELKKSFYKDLANDEAIQNGQLLVILYFDFVI